MRETKAESWARLIAEQEAGGESVRTFCRRHSVGAKSFYWWRRRLRENDAVRFAVVETLPVPTSVGLEPVLELVLANGERLRIAQGVDATTLRLTLDAIRA
jgi:transposase-like protein